MIARKAQLDQLQTIRKRLFEIYRELERARAVGVVGLDEARSHIASAFGSLAKARLENGYEGGD